jgi:hypothetical protein
MEFFDLARIPPAVMGALCRLAVPYDVFLAHSELGLEQTACKIRDVRKPAGARPRRPASAGLFWRDFVAKADGVLVPDAQAEAFALSLSLHGNTRVALAMTESRRLSKRSNRATTCLGLVPVRECALEHQFMRGIIVGLTRARPDLDVVVTGRTHDDSDLMRAGAFVTGAVEPFELDRLFRRLRFDRIVLCTTQPLFGHPIPSAVMACALPVAYFDWSHGHCPVRDGDLALDPSLPAAVVVERLSPWLQGSA